MVKNRVNPRIIVNLICVLCMIAVLVLQMVPYWQYDDNGETKSASIMDYVWFPKDNGKLQGVFQDAVEEKYQAAIAELGEEGQQQVIREVVINEISETFRTSKEKEYKEGKITKSDYQDVLKQIVPENIPNLISADTIQAKIEKKSPQEVRAILEEHTGCVYDLNKNVTAPAIQLAATLPVFVLWILPFLFELVTYPVRAAKTKKSKEKARVWEGFGYSSLLAPICGFISGVVGVWGYLINETLVLGVNCQTNLIVSIALVVISLLTVPVHVKYRDL